VIDTRDLPSIIRATYDRGLELANHIDAYLASLAALPDGSRRNELSDQHRERCEALRDRVSSWFGVVAVTIAPYTAYERQYVTELMFKVDAATADEYPEQAHPVPLSSKSASLPRSYETPEVASPVDRARADVREAMAETLRIVRTAASVVAATAKTTREEHLLPETAFILMWMDESRLELVDVHQVVKETFAEFSVQAYRADEVQHQDRITDLILEKIRNADFLFADLTGERPNVYYEVGYAHALGKRPLLYRRFGTPLHFDLSVHNIPEYRNMTDLRRLLRERLQAIRHEARLPVRRAQESQTELLMWVRERLRAAATHAVPKMAGSIDFSALVLNSDGFYEMSIQDRKLFRALRKIIDGIARQADLGWGVTLRCPSLEEELKRRQTRLKRSSA
jgi:hypothetical protein